MQVPETDTTRRVVVLGAGGFIGERVVAALRASGWARPVIATRRPVAWAEGVEQARVDATDEAGLAGVLQNAHSVVNCVAGPPAAILANARALFSAAGRSAAQPRVVYLSTMAVYGSTTGNVDESVPTLRDLSEYGTAKVAAERIAAAYPNAIVLRPGIVYGPRSAWWSLQIARLLSQRRLGDLGVSGQGICNLLYVEDMAAAALRALREPDIEGRCFNLAMTGAPTWNDYFALYAQALGATPVRRISAARLSMELHLLGPVLRTLELGARAARLGSQPPPPIRPWLVRLTRHRLRLDVSAAERALKMTWTPLGRALETTAAWFARERDSQHQELRST